MVKQLIYFNIHSGLLFFPCLYRVPFGAELVG